MLSPFEQLNIFLAILIEGYTKVKEGMSDSKSIIEELQSVLYHETRRLQQLFSKCSSDFVSDDRLAYELTAILKNMPTTKNRAVSDYASVALGNFMEVFKFSHTARTRLRA